ncbi:MAG TPA: pyridoxal-dependent decarboxylase [Paucimonas sp.]|nr:pyridoxal-dependent decarboxylase [Paucimonas sp.]
MHPLLAHDLKHADELLDRTRAYAAAVVAGLAERPVTVRPEPPAHRPLPPAGIGFDAALDDFRARWAPGFSGSAGPRYLGFVTGGATPAGIAGDWLTAAFDQNPTAGLDSTAPDLERETIAWLRDLFGLSDAQHGCFVTGATMSNAVGLAIGREWIGETKGICVSQEGLAALGAVTVLSGAPHSSIYKGLSLLGIGRKSLRRLPSLPQREAVDLEALEQALRELKGEPAIVVANCGTVNTVDFDDLAAIVALKRRYPFWLHVDAAFGGFAALLPEHAHLVAALDAADSICIDCHKWLNVPYDSAVQFTRRRDLQSRVFQNNAAYLGMPLENPDFVHLTPENSRRLRALAAWFALASYGRDGQRDIVARNIEAARTLGERIGQEPRLRLLAPVRMNVVCFTLADAPTESRIQSFVERLRDDGEAFLTPTVLHGVWALRAAFSNWRTTPEDVDRIFDAVRRACP